MLRVLFATLIVYFILSLWGCVILLASCWSLEVVGLAFFLSIWWIPAVFLCFILKSPLFLLKYGLLFLTFAFFVSSLFYSACVYIINPNCEGADFFLLSSLIGSSLVIPVLVAIKKMDKP